MWRESKPKKVPIDLSVETSATLFSWDLIAQISKISHNREHVFFKFIQQGNLRPEEFFSLVKCADYLGSEQLIRACQRFFSNVSNAKRVAASEDFNPKQLPEYLLAQLLPKGIKAASEWHKVMNKWIERDPSRGRALYKHLLHM